MKDVRGSDFSGEDILKRSNFDDLKECILNLTTTETGEMKAGLKVSLGFVLKKTGQDNERSVHYEKHDEGGRGGGFV